MLAELPKSPGKEGKTLKKATNSSQKKKARNSKKQGKEDQGCFAITPKFASRVLDGLHRCTGER